MTGTQWKALPPLVRRGDVERVGLKRTVLTSITYELKPGQTVESCPEGMLAARRVGKKLMFVKSTVSRLLPREFREG